MLWIKAFHIIFVVTWFSGLFYLPRLYVYHAMADDAISIARFKVMERRLYYGITLPGAVLATLTGGWLLLLTGYWRLPWMQAKLVLVLILWLYQGYLGSLYKTFKNDGNQHSHRFYRLVNEFPTLLLIAIVILVVVKPG